MERDLGQPVQPNTRKDATLTAALQINELVDADRHVRLPVDPYVMGTLVAEGSLETEGVSFASADPEIVERVRENLPLGAQDHVQRH
jgi:hypothetical protein